MNHNALKWAAIGAGAWLLYRYFTKPKAKAEEESTSWIPSLPDPQGVVDYFMGKPKRF